MFKIIFFIILVLLFLYIFVIKPFGHNETRFQSWTKPKTNSNSLTTAVIK